MNRVVFIVAAVIVFLGLTAQAANLDCQQQHCVGVIDAGSTGSRFHLYAYDLDEHNNPVHIAEFWSKKVKPGFASLENNQVTVDSYVTNLVAGAPLVSVPIYFYATAGMRLLPQPKQAQMLAYLKAWFSHQSQWQLKEAKTITGKEEGLFGWLAVNYQLGTLADENKVLVGVMDMGGASVQIAFQAANDGDIKDSDRQQIDLYGRHLNLFIHSFLGLGQTEVSHQFLNKECCFPNNYILPEGSQAVGDAYRCQSAVSSMINSVHHVNDIVQKALSNNPVRSWYAMGGVVDTVKSQPFDFLGDEFNNQSMLTQAQQNLCNQDWEILQNQYPGNDYLYGYCLFPAYYYALMVDGYGIDSTKTINYLPMTMNADWTIGVVLMR